MNTSVQHKTGYLFQYEGGSSGYGTEEIFHAPVESWHRTLNGAVEAKKKNGGRGSIYRLTGEDSSQLVGGW